MAARPGLAHRALWPVVDGLRALGYDPKAILKSSGLSEDAIQDPEGRIDHSAAMRLWTSAVALTGDPDLGIHIAESASWASFDLHTYLMTASDTLGEAYGRMCRYQRLIHDRTRVELLVEGESATLRHTIPGGTLAPRQPAEFLATAWLRIGRHLAQVGWAPTQVKFAHPAPSVVREHERVFQAPIRFTAGENALVFPSELLHLPCRTADPGLLAVLSRHADQILSVLPQTDSWSDRIRRTAAEELGRGTAPVEQVARRLGLSVRSLQRRLAEEGTSYTELLDGIRHELAVRYFRDSRLSIAQIALLLGYAETSSFDRSFRRWCGMSPSDYRAGKTKPLPG